MHALAQLLAHQQMAAGMLGATLLGSVLFTLKALPGKLWSHVVDQFSVTLTIEGSDPLYEQLDLWFARRGLAAAARRLMLSPEYDYDAGEWRWLPTLGRGWHLRFWRGRPILINREISEGGDLAKVLGRAGANRRLWIATLGRSPTPIRALIAEVEEIYNSDGLVRIFYWTDGGYRIADARRPRPMSTVFLPRAQKARLVQDLQRFIGARADYERRGTPYRRGYLLEGPPGTGKTSLIFALAGLVGRDVYAINLANVASDNGLMAAFNEIPKKGVAVIEDIDTADVSRDRKLVEAERAPAVPGAIQAQPIQRLTLSGLLNAIDGLAAREARVLFVTSNAPETLDPALLRPGRIDLRERVDLLGREPALEMFCAFAPDAPAELFERLVAPRLPLSGSALQGLLQALPQDAPQPISLAAEAARRRA